MAYSIKRYVGDGATQNFALTYPYINKADIHVYVDEVEVSYSWVTDSTIQTTVPPANGTTVSIERITERTVALVDFQDATVLKEASLDLNTAQLLYIVQESLDHSEESLVINLAGQYDAGGLRIVNVADPINAQDAATYAWVDSYTAAQVAACSASEAAAAASEAAAAISETNAAASEAAAAISETNAAASEAAALASENKAQKWAEELEDVEVDPGEYSAHHWAIKAQSLAGGDQLTVGTGGTPPLIYKIEAWNDDSNSTYIRFANITTGKNATDGFLVGIDGGEQASVWNLENTALVFGTNNTERLRISAAGNIQTNVLAGDTFKLEMHETTSNAIYTHYTNLTTGNTNADGVIVGIDASENMMLWNKEATDIRIATSDTERMRLKSDGKVGIGITAPVQKLHVSDTAAAHAYTHYSNLTTGHLSTQGWDFGAVSDGRGTVWGRGANDFSLGTSGVERLTVKADGKVCIGNGAANRLFNLYGGSSGESQIHLSHSTTGNAWSDGSMLGIGATGTLYVWNYENDNLIVGTNNTERMRINAGGTISIGTTSSSGHVHISSPGEVALALQSSNSTVGQVYVSFRDSANAEKGYLGFAGTANDIFSIWSRENSEMRLGTNNTEWVRITSTGDVGVGISNPQHRMHLHGPTYAYMLFTSDTVGSTTNDGAYIGLGSNTDFYIYNKENTNIRISTNFTERMIITNTGKVGIGTSAPDAALHVRGGESSSGALASEGDDFVVESGTNGGMTILTPNANYSSIFFGSPTKTSAAILRYTPTGTTYAIATNITGGKIEFRTGLYAFAGSIESNGGMVWGAPTGGSKGAGTINAQAVYDDNTLLTDYVFDKKLGVKTFEYGPRIQQKYDELDTNLMNAENYGQYWKANHRLPGMPEKKDAQGNIVQLSIGEMVQRLTEVCEMQSIIIDELHERLKAVEPPGPPQP